MHCGPVVILLVEMCMLVMVYAFTFVAFPDRVHMCIVPRFCRWCHIPGPRIDDHKIIRISLHYILHNNIIFSFHCQYMTHCIFLHQRFWVTENHQDFKISCILVFQAYGKDFIHDVHCKHLLAKKYFYRMLTMVKFMPNTSDDATTIVRNLTKQYLSKNKCM